MLGMCGKLEEREDEFPEMTVKKASNGGDHPQEEEGMKNEFIL